MATSTIKNEEHIVILTQNGTTTNQGSIDLSNVNRLTDNGYWYVKVLDWQNMSVVANTNMNLEICVIRKNS